jgi:Thioredoxin
MRTLTFLLTKGRSLGWNFWIISLALIAGLVLSILSWLELCVEHCSANQEYRFFGLLFAIVGMIFFTVLISLHFLSLRYHFLGRIVRRLIAAAVGAEIMLILIQKYQIGFWCPVCLSIAAAVAIAALVLATGYLKNFTEAILNHNRGDIMQKVKQGFTSFFYIFLGFILAFIGTGKPNDAEATVNDIKDRMAFGTKDSPIEVYLITDWFCPLCKKIESKIETLYPKIQSHVAFYFIDYPIHRQSLNFTPYHVAFLVNEKDGYFIARRVLNELSEKNATPNEAAISSASQKNGINFKNLSFLEIRAGIDFFDKITEKYHIRSTPTVVIVNTKNNKFIKLHGKNEINESKILEGIEKVKSSSF